MMNQLKSLLVLFLVTIFIKLICTLIDTIIILQDSFVMDAHGDSYKPYSYTLQDAWFQWYPVMS